MLSKETSQEVSLASDPLIELTADLTEDALYGTRHLSVTASEVTVAVPGGAPLLRVPIEDISKARHEPLTSGGRLLLRLKNGEEITAVTYSLGAAHQFSEAARGIEQLAEGKELKIDLTVEQDRCQKCGRLLPEKDGVCPSCIKRGRTLLRVAGFLKPYKKPAIMLGCFALTATVLNLAPPLIQRRIIDGLIGHTLNGPGLLVCVLMWLGAAATGTVL